MPDGSGGTLLARSLVGRDAELRALQDAWRDGSAARIVTAPAGVGKSRLVRELGSWARAGGGLVLAGRCSPTGQDTPLRPWREALLATAREGRRPPDDLAAFVPALARVVPEWGDATADPSALVLGEAVVRLLSSWTTAGTTTLLIIDDLHWADPESLTVLEYVVDNLAGTPLLVVATLRGGEPGPGTDLATDLVARRAALAVRLDPLGDDDVLAVARSCLDGGDLPEGAGAALVARCDGVPFLVEELLATAVRSGWDTITDDVPGSVAASVATRLDDLPPAARPLLLVAALLGRQFDWTLAAAAAGLVTDEAAELLRQGVRAQLLDVDGAGFRFRHALTRDAVLATGTAAEQAPLARRALDALTATDAELDGELGPLAAGLAAVAGDADRAAEQWLRSARRALEEGALASAESLAGHARGAGSSAVGDAVDEVLLRVCALSGQTERAGELGVSLLASRTDPTERADVHLVLGTAELAAGRWDAAEEHATAARTLTGSDPARLARGDALAAQAAIGRNDLDTAVALATAALEGARRTAQAAVECEALEVIGRAERGRDVVKAEAAFAEAHDIAAAAGLRLWQVRAMQELGTIDMFGSLAPERLLEARRMAVSLGALATAAVVDLQLGALYDERGDLAECLAAARRCEEASRRWRLSTLPMSLAVQAAALARLGDREGMQHACDAAIATGEDQDYVQEAVQGNTVAIFHIVQGDLAAAARAADAAMVVLRRNPGAAQPFPGLWALLRTLLDDDGEAARGEVASLPVDAPVSRELLMAADAVALGQAGQREAAAARFADADAALGRRQGGFRRAFARLLVGPAALADGWGEPLPWLRETLATFEAKGLDALAARCRTVLREAGAPVPRRGRGDSAVVPAALAALGITSREADVLALVAAGATNREVGETLFISVRTVDKHVERLLQKAGTTRAGLTELARAAGLLRT